VVGVDATMVEVNSAPHRETMEALWERVLKCWSQNGLNRGRDCQSPRRLGSGLRGLMDTNQEKILPRATGDYPPRHEDHLDSDMARNPAQLRFRDPCAARRHVTAMPMPNRWQEIWL
jgi:hypothetical protein